MKKQEEILKDTFNFFIQNENNNGEIVSTLFRLILEEKTIQREDKLVKQIRGSFIEVDNEDEIMKRYLYCENDVICDI